MDIKFPLKTQNLFNDIDKHIQNDIVPSLYLNTLHQHAEFYYDPFSMLSQLKSIQQSPVHHPEGNVWNHVLLVVDKAAQIRHLSKNPKVFMWAALLHDIGKTTTTKVRKGKITSYDHDKTGAQLCIKFLTCFTSERIFIRQVSAMTRYHMHILYVLNSLPYKNINKLNQETDLYEIALLGYCDRMGRTNAESAQVKKEIIKFLEQCNFDSSKFPMEQLPD